MTKYLLILLIGLTSLGCSSDDDSSENNLVIYNQTYCSDPWESMENNRDLVDQIITYFATKNIVISNVTFDDKGTQQVCLACFCLTGKRIILEVNKNDLEAIKEYGFQEYK